MNLVFKLYKLSQRCWAGSRNPSSTILQKNMIRVRSWSAPPPSLSYGRLPETWLVSRHWACLLVSYLKPWWEVTDVGKPDKRWLTWAPHSVTFVWFTCELLTWAECRFFLMLFLMQIKNISELTTTTFNITFLHNWWFLDLRLDGIVRSVCTCAERAEILYNRNTFFNLKVHHRHIRKQDT